MGEVGACLNFDWHDLVEKSWLDMQETRSIKVTEKKEADRSEWKKK